MESPSSVRSSGVLGGQGHVHLGVRGLNPWTSASAALQQLHNELLGPLLDLERASSPVWVAKRPRCSCLGRCCLFVVALGTPLHCWNNMSLPLNCWRRFRTPLDGLDFFCARFCVKGGRGELRTVLSQLGPVLRAGQNLTTAGFSLRVCSLEDSSVKHPALRLASSAASFNVHNEI